MRGSVDVAKGRVEEAAGALVNDDKLRDKGRTDQAVGRVKQAAEATVRRAKDEACKIVDHAKDVGKQAVDKAKGRAYVHDRSVISCSNDKIGEGR